MIETQPPALSRTTSTPAASSAPAVASATPLASQADPAELVYLFVLMSTALAGWGGVVLAELGLFAPGPVAVGILVALTVTFLVLRRLRTGKAGLKSVDWVPVALVLLCVPLYFRPHEFILGGADAGVYVNTGVNLARTGALFIRDPEVAQIERDVWPSLFRAQPAGSPVGFVRFPGYYLSDDQPGLVIPQFFALQSVWIALAALAGGVKAGLYMTPVWGVLGVLGLYYAGRALFGRPVGALGAFLLAITPTQVWFARYPTAEVLTQALMWGGFYAWAVFTARDEAPRPLGLVAGLALGSAFLARIDVPYLVLLPAGWLVYRLATHQAQRRDLWFLLPFTALAIHGAVHALVFSRPYTLSTYGGVSFLAREAAPLILAAGIIGVVGLAAIRNHSFHGDTAPIHALVEQFRYPVRMGLVAGLIGLAVYGYIIRPRLGAIQWVPYLYGATEVPLSDHENMVRLGWYLTPLGIWLGVAGMALIAWREPWRRIWFPLGLALMATVLYLYRLLNNPHHIYAMRRYVPLVIPLFTLAGVYALVWLWHSPAEDGRRRIEAVRHSSLVLRRLLPLALGLALVLWLGYQDRAVLPQVDYAGLVGQVSDLAAGVSPGSVVVFDDPAPVGSGALIGTPLQYLFGLSVFDLQVGWSRAGLAAAVRLGLGQGRPVYLLARPGGAAAQALADAGLRVELQRRATIDVPYLEWSYDHFPTAINRLVIPLDVYRVAGPAGVGVY